MFENCSDCYENQGVMCEIRVAAHKGWGSATAGTCIE